MFKIRMRGLLWTFKFELFEPYLYLKKKRYLEQKTKKNREKNTTSTPANFPVDKAKKKKN